MLFAVIPMIRLLPVWFLLIPPVLSPCALASSSSIGDRRPDVVQLKNGELLEGRVVFENDQHLILRQGARETKIEVDRIDSVQSLERSLGFVLDHARVVPDQDVRSLGDLARTCTAKDLTGIAGLIHYKTLLTDPMNRFAHESLGHRERNRDWTSPLDGKWYRWRALLEKRTDWNSAWKLETTHYELRTNLDLEAAVNAALDLERFYLFFHEAIGSRIGIHGVSKPLSARIHSDVDSYPRLGGDRAGWYDQASRTLIIDGTRSYLRLSLMHEATHQLLEVGKNGLIDTGSTIPAWLGEGLAEYMANSALGPAGRAQFQLGRPSMMHIYNHADAERPTSLDRVLALSVSDFLAPREPALLYALAYSLVHFCLHGGDQSYRKSFFEYMRDSVNGKGSPARFKKRVARDVPAFERAWTEHVSRLSGGR